MSELEKIIDSISVKEKEECQENLRINFEASGRDSRMNMIAFD